MTMQGEAYELYLTQGVHTISMAVKFGAMTPIIESINSDISILSDILLKVTLIAGSTPDPNYDYGFFEKIPNMKQDLEALSESMEWKYEELKEDVG